MFAKRYAAIARAYRAGSDWSDSRIAAGHGVGTFQVALQLGAHQIVAQLQFRRILFVPIGAGLCDFGQGGDTLFRHRVRAHVGAHSLRSVELVVGEALEGLIHSLGALPGRSQELDAALVRLLLLLALVGQQRKHHRRLRGHHGGHGGITSPGAAACAGHRGADAEQHGEDRGGLGVGKFGAQFHQVPAGDMSGFVRQHADDLIGRL